jgi:hypothetical protein
VESVRVWVCTYCAELLLVLLLSGDLLQNFEDLIQDALRIIAYSMEAQNWELVRWFLNEHQSPDLGAYFLPIIAQVSKGICAHRDRAEDTFGVQVTCSHVRLDPEGRCPPRERVRGKQQERAVTGHTSWRHQ